MRLRDSIALLVGAAVIAVTAVAYLAAVGARDQERDQAHVRDAREVKAAVERELEGAISSVEASAAFFRASSFVATPGFHDFTVGQLDRTALRGLGVMLRVDRADRAAFERAHGVRISELGPNRTLVPARSRPTYFPVVYSEAAGARARSFAGFDASSEPQRSAAMIQAAYRGGPVATPPLRSASGRWSVFVYVPLLTAGDSSSPPRLVGFVTGSLDIAAILDAALAGRGETTAVRVLDGDRSVFASPGALGDGFVVRPVEFAGRRWLLKVGDSAGPGHAVLRWTGLAGGILIIALVLALVWRLRREADVAERLAAARTRELQLALAEAERMRAEVEEQNERLLELDRMKDELVSTVSHELRTPLTSIQGFVEVLLEDEEPGTETVRARHLAVIMRNVEKLRRLVGDLLFVARANAGGIELSRDAVDLSRLVAESAEAFEPAAREKQVELVVDCTDSAPVLGDRIRLTQLADNLLSNAIKFTPAGGRVSVRVRAAGRAARIEIEDTGAGIPVADQLNVFDRFYRTESAMREAVPGTGLGLAIARAIVEAHGGLIELESEEGVGTTIRVHVPAAPALVAAA